jgi:hypothetical protein
MVRLTHLSHICNAHRRRARIRSGAPATPRRHARALRGVLAAALLCATLGGCAGGIESVYSSGFWAQPGKYDFIKCPEIARRMAGDSAAESNLSNLMSRADQDPAGPVINLMVYRSQLEQIRADKRVLEQTSREKGCKAPSPTPTPATRAKK